MTLEESGPARRSFPLRQEKFKLIRDRLPGYTMTALPGWLPEMFPVNPWTGPEHAGGM